LFLEEASAARVRRKKANVQWTLDPSNGFATLANPVLQAKRSKPPSSLQGRIHGVFRKKQPVSADCLPEPRP
jgi:hypothetical protein